MLLAVLPTPGPKHGGCGSHSPVLPRTQRTLSRYGASCAWSPELAHSNYSLLLDSSQMFPVIVLADTCATTAGTMCAQLAAESLKSTGTSRQVRFGTHLVATWELLDGPLEQQISTFGRCFASGVDVPDPQSKRSRIPQQLLFIQQVLLRRHQVVNCIFRHSEISHRSKNTAGRSSATKQAAGTNSSRENQLVFYQINIVAAGYWGHSNDVSQLAVARACLEQ